MKTCLIAFAVLLCSSCSSVPAFRQDPPTHYSPAEFEAAIRSGIAGSEWVERTKRGGRIEIWEEDSKRIPYQVFFVQNVDASEGYTLLVEQESRIVTLCGGVGGGIAHDFAVKRRRGATVIHFRSEVGSGVNIRIRGKHVVLHDDPKTRPNLK